MGVLTTSETQSIAIESAALIKVVARVQETWLKNDSAENVK